MNHDQVDFFFPYSLCSTITDTSSVFPTEFTEQRTEPNTHQSDFPAEVLISETLVINTQLHSGLLNSVYVDEMRLSARARFYQSPSERMKAKWNERKKTVVGDRKGSNSKQL